jgi:hypothetical protein
VDIDATHKAVRLLKVARWTLIEKNKVKRSATSLKARLARTTTAQAFDTTLLT